MKDNKPLIPITDDGKNDFYGTLIPYINLPANQLRFKTVPDTLTTLNSHYTEWGVNWVKFKDDTQRTTVIVNLKNTLEVQIDEEIDKVYIEIPNSILTTDDKAIFQIFPRKIPITIVVSDIAPGIVLDTIGHLWAKVLFVNSKTPTSKAAPIGNFIFFQNYVGLAGIADADVAFWEGNVTSTSSHTFHFTKDQVGQTCYIECFYQIKKGHRSPSSIIISFIVV